VNNLRAISTVLILVLFVPPVCAVELEHDQEEDRFVPDSIQVGVVKLRLAHSLGDLSTNFLAEYIPERQWGQARTAYSLA